MLNISKIDKHITNALQENPKLFAMYDEKSKRNLLKSLIDCKMSIPINHLAEWYELDNELVKQYIYELLYYTQFTADIKQHTVFIDFCLHNMDELIQTTEEALYYLDIFSKAMKNQNMSYFIKRLILVYEGEKDILEIIVSKIKNEFPSYSRQLLKQLKFITELM